MKNGSKKVSGAWYLAKPDKQRNSQVIGKRRVLLGFKPYNK